MSTPNRPEVEARVHVREHQGDIEAHAGARERTTSLAATGPVRSGWTIGRLFGVAIVADYSILL